MNTYCINKAPQANGDHEVHRTNCYYVPEGRLCHLLGDFENCHDAVQEATKTYPTANGCRHCCPTCHQAR